MNKSLKFVGLGAMLACVLVFGGCGMTAQVKLTSVESNAYLDLEPTLLAYRFSDKNTADIYMTDLPRDVLDPRADLTGISGQLTHVHLFVAPEAGKTPIDDTACSVSIRHVVLAQGQIGVYGGGGFLYPYRRLGREYLKGTIDGATLRLIRSTPGFEDKLGAVELQATIKAPLDDPMCSVLAERLRTLMDKAEKIVREEPTPPEPIEYPDGDEKPADDAKAKPETKPNEKAGAKADTKPPTQPTAKPAAKPAEGPPAPK